MQLQYKRKPSIMHHIESWVEHIVTPLLLTFSICNNIPHMTKILELPLSELYIYKYSKTNLSSLA